MTARQGSPLAVALTAAVALALAVLTAVAFRPGTSADPMEVVMAITNDTGGPPVKTDVERALLGGGTEANYSSTTQAGA